MLARSSVSSPSLTAFLPSLSARRRDARETQERDGPRSRLRSSALYLREMLRNFFFN
jgi:hypothetical protein